MINENIKAEARRIAGVLLVVADDLCQAGAQLVFSVDKVISLRELAEGEMDCTPGVLYDLARLCRIAAVIIKDELHDELVLDDTPVKLSKDFSEFADLVFKEDDE